MEFEITEWFVKSFSNTVLHLAQQKSVRIANFARQESQSAKMKSYDIIGGTEVREKQSRHEDTPRMDMEHKRRNVIMRDFDWATLVDDVDKIRLLNTPTSEYVIEAKNAFNRKKDQVFIEAFSAPVITGENGDGVEIFPNSQRIASVNGSNIVPLNIATLRLIKKKFRKSEVIAEDGDDKTIHMAVTADELDDLLASTEVTSSDYNTVKALVNGEVNAFMGITFHHTEQLISESDTSKKFNVSTGEFDAAGTSIVDARRCLAWVQSGMIIATGKDITARISERSDKCYSVQPYVAMTVGGVRIEDAKCMEVYVERS